MIGAKSASDKNDHIKQESQRQIKLTERPIRRREESSERHERSKSTLSQVSISSKTGEFRTYADKIIYGTIKI